MSLLSLPAAISFVVKYLSLPKQARDNQQYVAMVQRVLATPGFYISYTYDLSLSFQRGYQLSQAKQNSPPLSLYERADHRFVWNAYLLRDLVVVPSLKRFYVPLIHGFVEVKKDCSINGKYFTFALISRRSCQRAGNEPHLPSGHGSGQMRKWEEGLVCIDMHLRCCKLSMTMFLLVPLVSSHQV